MAYRNRQVNSVQIKQFARSQIMVIGRSDWEEMDKRGNTAYYSAKTLLGTLRTIS
jgi:hypothetical protein